MNGSIFHWVSFSRASSFCSEGNECFMSSGVKLKEDEASASCVDGRASRGAPVGRIGVDIAKKPLPDGPRNGNGQPESHISSMTLLKNDN